jgi:hypothetical protein
MKNIIHTIRLSSGAYFTLHQRDPMCRDRDKMEFIFGYKVRSSTECVEAVPDTIIATVILREAPFLECTTSQIDYVCQLATLVKALGFSPRPRPGHRFHPETRSNAHPERLLQ